MTSKKSYSELLRHPKWQMKRLRILNRDEAKCRLCGDNETELHVHHTEYKKGRNPWEYDDDTLITLCKYCHVVIEYCKHFPAWVIFKISHDKNRSVDFYITIYFFDKTEDCYSMGFFKYDVATNKLIPLIAVREGSIQKALVIIEGHRVGGTINPATSVAERPPVVICPACGNSATLGKFNTYKCTVCGHTEKHGKKKQTRT